MDSRRQDINERPSPEHPGAEVQDRLLTHDDSINSQNSRDLRVAGDSTPSALSRRTSENYVGAVPDNGQKTTGLSSRDYAPRILWNSIWLHDVVLFGFAALFAALFIALILLYHFSGVHHGLSVQISRNKYSWTYGPTAGECPLGSDQVGFPSDP